VREAVAFLLLVCACGAATVKGRAYDAARPDTEGRAGGFRADRDGGFAGESGAQGFVTLEARASALAPGLRQAAERESAGERVELVRATGRDACVRVAFEATAPVTARLVDSDGGVLAELRAPASEGALGERGPVCVRKGDGVSGIAEGGGARVKWIAWASP
jgi:hypothetical protein